MASVVRSAATSASRPSTPFGPPRVAFPAKNPAVTLESCTPPHAATRSTSPKKPLDVMQWLLKINTGLVVDPFVGSGTTARSAVLRRRDVAGDRGSVLGAVGARGETAEDEGRVTIAGQPVVCFGKATAREAMNEKSQNAKQANVNFRQRLSGQDWPVPVAWSCPELGRGDAAAVPKRLSLESGNVILTINGERISGRDERIRAVNRSPRTMTFWVRDRRNGTIWETQTDLRRGRTRFGVNIIDNGGDGAGHVR